MADRILAKMQSLLKIPGLDAAQLEKEIQKFTGVRIKSKKLSAILKGEKNIDTTHPLSLTPDELGALDGYLAHFGLHLFEKPTLLSQITETGTIDIFVGAKPRELLNLNSINDGRFQHDQLTTDVGMWDVQAFGALMKNCLAHRPVGLSFEVEAVFPDDDWEVSRVFPGPEEAIQKAMLHRPSVVSIGSPLASIASESLVCKMLEIEPYFPTRSNVKLPFRFFWPEERLKGKRSSMMIQPCDQENFKMPVPQQEQADLVLVCEGIKPLIEHCTHPDQGCNSYGVAVAKRLPSGRGAAVALMGQTGPATLALCHALGGQLADYPLPQNERHVWWSVIGVPVTIADRKKGDNRTPDLKNIVVIKEPHAYDPERRKSTPIAQQGRR